MTDRISESIDQKVIRKLLKDGFERDQEFRLCVTSTSMTPLLKPGDWITIQKVDPTLLRIGDLVVLERESHLIIHRFFNVDREGRYLTKGDNRTSSDPPVGAVDIVGRVIRIEKGQKNCDLTRRKWVRMNRIMGSICKWEAKLVDTFLRGQYIHHSKRSLGEKFNRIKANQGGKGTIARKVNHLLRLPFRILTRFVVGIALVRS